MNVLSAGRSSRSVALLAVVALVLGGASAGAQGDPEGAEGEPAPEPGFVVEDGSAVGSWVRLELDNESGDLRRFRVEDLGFLFRVDLPGPFQWSLLDERLVLEGDGFRVTIHDHRRGIMRIESEAQPVSIFPGSGVGIWERDSHVELRVGGSTAVLTNAVVDRHAFFVSSGTFLRLGDDVDMLSAREGDAEAASQMEMIDALAAAGRLAAWVEVGPDGIRGTELSSLDMELQEHRESTYRVIADSPRERARLVVVDVAPDLVDEERFQVSYFEEVARFLIPTGIQRADSLEGLVEGLEGEEPVYWVVDDLDGVRAVIALAPGKAQGVEVGWGPPRADPVIVVGVLAGLVAVSVAVALLVSDRWRFLR